MFRKNIFGIDRRGGGVNNLFGDCKPPKMRAKLKERKNTNCDVINHQ